MTRRRAAPPLEVRTPAGRRNQRVRFYEDTKATNSDGQRVESESLLYKRWAEVRPVSAKEDYGQGKTRASIDFVVRVLHDDATKNLTPANWLRLSDGRRLDISRAINRNMLNEEMELECVERVN